MRTNTARRRGVDFDRPVTKQKRPPHFRSSKNVGVRILCSDTAKILFLSIKNGRSLQVAILCGLHTSHAPCWATDPAYKISKSLSHN